MLRLLREEGIGVDVASAGELAFARAAGFRGEEIVVHGNNKDEAFLREAAAEGATVVLDAPDEAELAAAAGVRRVLVRVTLGVDADTHEAIRTGHHGSKFGLPPAQARALIEDALARGLDVLGLHVHIGSQLADFDAQAETIVRLASFAASCRDTLGWTARVADLGGGFGIRHNLDEHAPDAAVLAASAVETARTGVRRGGACRRRRCGSSRAARSSAPRASRSTASAPSSGCPSAPGSRSTAACRTTHGRSSTTPSTRRSRPTGPTSPRGERVSIAGMHCESGDVLIDDVALPAPRRGDLLAVPATGAYTLAMASNYNGVARPAAVLVGDGEARLIRRRETIDDLLRAEV